MNHAFYTLMLYKSFGGNCWCLQDLFSTLTWNHNNNQRRNNVRYVIFYKVVVNQLGAMTSLWELRGGYFPTDKRGVETNRNQDEKEEICAKWTWMANDTTPSDPDRFYGSFIYPHITQCPLKWLGPCYATVVNVYYICMVGRCMLITHLMLTLLKAKHHLRFINLHLQLQV